MKKAIVFILIIFILVCAKSNNVQAKGKPIIDGYIDEIWDTAVAMQAEVGYEEGMAHGYSKVLWIEDTLYLLANVEDDTMSSLEDTLSDGVMFMISYGEDNKKERWCGFTNTTGKIFFDTRQGELFGNATCEVRQNENFYVVEIALPTTKETSDVVMDCIGFNFFIIDDKNEDYGREHLCSWKEYANEIWDWENFGKLFEVQLVEKSKKSIFTYIAIAGAMTLGMGIIIILVGKFMNRKRRKV